MRLDSIVVILFYLNLNLYYLYLNYYYLNLSLNKYNNYIYIHIKIMIKPHRFDLTQK